MPAATLTLGAELINEAIGLKKQFYIGTVIALRELDLEIRQGNSCRSPAKAVERLPRTRRAGAC